MAGIPVKIYEATAPIPQVPPSQAAPTLGRVSDFFARVTGRSDTIPSDALRNSLSGFLASLGEALGGVPASLAGYRVDEIELSLEVGASGEVSLIVGSAELEGKAGIKLTLKRS